MVQTGASHQEHGTKARTDSGSTKGLRALRDLKYDDLTYKALLHFEALGLREFFEDNVATLGSNILQSPLERVVFAFLLISDFGINVPQNQVHIALPGDPLPTDLFERKSVAICPQHKVKGYFLDFGIFVNTGNYQFAFDLECDGLEFHGASNEQARHDFQRDVVVSKAGFQIYRCSGSDINRHPLYEVEKFGEEIRHQVDGLDQQNANLAS